MERCGPALLSDCMHEVMVSGTWLGDQNAGATCGMYIHPHPHPHSQGNKRCNQPPCLGTCKTRVQNLFSSACSCHKPGSHCGGDGCDGAGWRGSSYASQGWYLGQEYVEVLLRWPRFPQGD